MVLRVRIRSAKFQIDHNGSNRLSSYVVVIAEGNKFRTVTDKDGGREPVWEETLSFHNNPLKIVLEVWVEHPNGDIMVGEVKADLTQFYQREAFRIQPKLLAIGAKGKLTGEIKLQLDFDFEGVNKDNMMNKIKQMQGKMIQKSPEINKKQTDLEIGTVIAVGNKKAAQINEIKRQQQLQHQMNFQHEKPYQKPNSANNNYYPPKQQQRYDYGPQRHDNIKIPNKEHHGHKKGQNLFEMIGNNMNNQNHNQKRTNGDGWDL